MDLTGSVYDAKHGPQPRATGTTLATFADADAWQVVRGDQATPIQPRFLGYAVEGQVNVTFRYVFDLPRGGTATVAETPEIDGDMLVRTFVVSGLPDGLALRCPLDSGSAGGLTHAVRNATVSITATTETGATNKVTTGQSAHITSTGGKGTIAYALLDRNGTAVAETRWGEVTE